MKNTRRYALGLDFGTLSVRAVLIDTENGRTAASAVSEYPHGVIDRVLPTDAAGASERVLPGPDWALEHPQDWLDCMAEAVRKAVCTAGIRPGQIVGIGVDFTCSTVLPTDRDGNALCLTDKWSGNPHAWPKLWKHHAGAAYADRLTEKAKTRGELWLPYYGSRISSEWAIPKIWQTAAEAPEAADAADCFMEAGDWVVRKLCGTKGLNATAAGYKYLRGGMAPAPDHDFYAAVDPVLADIMEEKIPDVLPAFSCAGKLTGEAAEWLGLAAGTPIAAAGIDAHAAVPAAGLNRAGQMVITMGTSSCHMLISDRKAAVPGTFGTAVDGFIPGFYGYEAGQSAVGDSFAWVMENLVPDRYVQEAAARGITIHQLLTEKAEQLRPGESGLVALDWLNGNRSILNDANLSGLVVGLTLHTLPEELYRAEIEATAYGTRMINDNFAASGVPVEEIRVTGGISRKNRMAMQIYADVLHQPIHILDAASGSALGAAMYGAAAAGSAGGGHDSLTDASEVMKAPVQETVEPDAGNEAIYDELYGIYRELHEHFGRQSDIMKKLRGRSV